MYIVLRDADFSKSNIGNIDIDLPMDDLTVSIINKFSILPSEYIQKALNVFVINLKNSGLIDKIDSLYLPILSANVTEAFTDVIGLSSIDVTGKSYAITQNKGVHLSGSALLSFPISNTIDFHILAYNTDSIPVASGIGYSIGQDVYGFGRRIFGSGNNPGAFAGANENRIISDTNLGSGIGVQILSNNGVLSLLGDNGQIFSGAPAGNFASQNTIPLNAGSILITGSNFGIYSIGKYLNSDETVEYMGYVSSLMERLLV